MPGNEICSSLLPTMLVTLADGLDGKRGDRQVRRRFGKREVQEALVDATIDIDGKVRAMLLDRSDRQNGDSVCRELGEIR